MIENLEETIHDYDMELQSLREEEIIQKEYDSFTINGNHLKFITGIINEKIKIADTFSHYTIEKCNPKYVSILRKLIEEYEGQIEQIKSSDISPDQIDIVIQITISLDLLLGVDVSFYTVLAKMYHDYTIEKVYDYFHDNIDYELTYESLSDVITGRGYRKK